ncbi:MAG: methyltransferase family protein [Gemmatimonadota bacterium]
MRWFELRIPPPLVLLASGGAVFWIANAAPSANVSVPASRIAAVILVAAGMAIAAAGGIAFARMHTTVNPLQPEKASTLVTGGVYRFSRNPMYLGFLFVLAGWTLFLSNAAAAILLPLFAAYISQYQIKPEERALGGKFGSEYARYLSRVRRWL